MAARTPAISCAVEMLQARSFSIPMIRPRWPGLFGEVLQDIDDAFKNGCRVPLHAMPEKTRTIRAPASYWRCRRRARPVCDCVFHSSQAALQQRRRDGHHFEAVFLERREGAIQSSLPHFQHVPASMVRSSAPCNPSSRIWLAAVATSGENTSVTAPRAESLHYSFIRSSLR